MNRPLGMCHSKLNLHFVFLIIHVVRDSEYQRVFHKTFEISRSSRDVQFRLDYDIFYNLMLQNRYANMKDDNTHHI